MSVCILDVLKRMLSFIDHCSHIAFNLISALLRATENFRFSRMDAMLKHKKGEHDEPKSEPAARMQSSRGGKQSRKTLASPMKHMRMEESHETKSKRKKIHDDRTLSTGSHRTAIASRGLSEDETESPMSFQDKYRLAKAKLSYITQENEMLNDEYNELEKKLRRLRTERTILLDVLYRAEVGEEDNDGDKQDVVTDDDDNDDVDDEDEL